MRSPRLDESAAKLLEREDSAVPSPTSTVRAQAVGAIELALVARARARRRRRIILPLMLAAAAILVAGASYRAATREPSASTKASETASPAASTLPPPRVATAFFTPAGPSDVTPGVDGHVATVDDGSAYRLRTGTSIDVGARSDVVLPIDEREQIVVVREGSVTAHVVKLAPGTRFLVRTSTAEVEVRGTIFSVAERDREGCGRETTVNVEEGRVVVRAGGVETVVERGGHWNTPCAASAAARPAHAAAPSQSARPTAATASDLAAQNALYADAMAARRRSENATALATLDRLLGEHPRSPLREAAEAQRMKILADVDRPKAIAAARAYLAAYPNGLARRDAEALLVAP